MGTATTDGIRALGTLIRNRRRDLEWTQGVLAEHAGLTVGYISNIEKGYVNPKRGPVVPSDDSLRALSQALDLPTEDLHRALGRITEPAFNDEEARLRDAGILYAAGWSELPERVKAKILKFVEIEREELARERGEVADADGVNLDGDKLESAV